MVVYMPGWDATPEGCVGGALIGAYDVYGRPGLLPAALHVLAEGGCEAPDVEAVEGLLDRYAEGLRTGTRELQREAVTGLAAMMTRHPRG